jgi:hypothetical protein
VKNLIKVAIARDLANSLGEIRSTSLTVLGQESTALRRFANNKELWKLRIDCNSFRIWSGVTGIEPVCKAWEALNKTLKAIDLAALSFPSDGLNWKLVKAITDCDSLDES